MESDTYLHTQSDVRLPRLFMFWTETLLLNANVASERRKLWKVMVVGRLLDKLKVFLAMSLDPSVCHGFPHSV